MWNYLSFISVDKLYCELSESKSKYFLKKLHKFTNDGFRVVITWKTRNIYDLYFLLKIKTIINFVLSKKDLVLGVHAQYIGETKHNAEVRWNGLNNPTKTSEPLKHLCNSINHCVA